MTSKLCEVNVGYMSSIPETPTKYEVNYEILSTAETAMRELDLGHIFIYSWLEVGQAIYTPLPHSPKQATIFAWGELEI